MRTHYNSAKTHCPQGHRYTEGNTYTPRDGDWTGGRRCKLCHRMKQRARRGAKYQYTVVEVLDALQKLYIGTVSGQVNAEHLAQSETMLRDFGLV